VTFELRGVIETPANVELLVELVLFDDVEFEVVEADVTVTMNEY
jgi:hypothetical protein